MDNLYLCFNLDYDMELEQELIENSEFEIREFTEYQSIDDN